MLTMPSFKKSLIVEQFQRNYLNFKLLIPGALALSEMEEAPNIMGLPSTSTDTTSHTSLTEQPKLNEVTFSLMH